MGRVEGDRRDRGPLGGEGPDRGAAPGPGAGGAGDPGRGGGARATSSTPTSWRRCWSGSRWRCCRTWRRSSAGSGSSAPPDGGTASTTTRSRRSSTATCPAALREEYHALVAEAWRPAPGAGGKDPKDLDGALCVEIASTSSPGARGPRALRYLDPALDHLEKDYRNERAIRLCDLRARRARTPRRQGAGEGPAARARIRLDLLGRREPQRAAIEEALALAREIGDRHGRGRATGNLGIRLLGPLGRYAEAQEQYERRLALAREIGGPAGRGPRHGEPGERSSSRSRPLRRGAGAARAGLALAREIGDRQGEATATGNLGGRLPVPRPLRRGAGALRAAPRARAGDRGPGGRGPRHGEPGERLPDGLGRYAEAQAQHERSPRARAGDRGPRERGQRHGEPGECFRVPRPLRRGAGAARAGLALAREIGDRRGRGQRHGEPGASSSSRLGRYAEAQAHVERHLRLRGRSGTGGARPCTAGTWATPLLVGRPKSLRRGSSTSGALALRGRSGTGSCRGIRASTAGPPAAEEGAHGDAGERRTAKRSRCRRDRVPRPMRLGAVQRSEHFSLGDGQVDGGSVAAGDGLCDGARDRAVAGTESLVPRTPRDAPRRRRRGGRGGARAARGATRRRDEDGRACDPLPGDRQA